AQKAQAEREAAEKARAEAEAAKQAQIDADSGLADEEDDDAPVAPGNTARSDEVRAAEEFAREQTARRAARQQTTDASPRSLPDAGTETPAPIGTGRQTDAPDDSAFDKAQAAALAEIAAGDDARVNKMRALLARASQPGTPSGGLDVPIRVAPVNAAKAAELAGARITDPTHLPMTEELSDEDAPAQGVSAAVAAAVMAEGANAEPAAAYLRHSDPRDIRLTTNLDDADATFADDTTDALDRAMERMAAAPNAARASDQHDATAEVRATDAALADDAARAIDGAPALDDRAFDDQAFDGPIHDRDMQDAQIQPESAPEFEPEIVLPSAQDIRAQVRAFLGTTGLDQTQEAELVGELTEVEQAAAVLRATRARGRVRLQGAADETAVNRLLQQTDTQLQGPESQRRRSTIAQLKAAVAAARADERVDGPRRPELAEARVMTKYRADLETTVNPRKPEPEPAPQEPARPQRPASVDRPTHTRPVMAQAPLMLVSELRIDKPGAAQPAEPTAARTAAPGPVTPVRPRRVALSALAEVDTYDESDTPPAPAVPRFSQFAAQLDTPTLYDRMEAAAVYTARIEGRRQFGRAQLMHHVLELSDVQSSNREDVLRAFGSLLRKGRIGKVEQGIYELRPGSQYDGAAAQFLN
ncbi:hypothetical protein, partial [Roseicitreum antarcticum]